MRKKVIIIGAGPGGLAAAMLLAHADVDVTVFEREPYVGGRTSTIHSGGFRFDRGPTFFMYPRILAEIFATTGYDLFSEVELKRLDPQYRLVFGDGTQLDATRDAQRMEQQVAQLSPEDAGGFARFLHENRAKLDVLAPILERPFHGVRDLLRRDMLATLPVLRPWLSLHSEIGRTFQDPRLRLAFTFQGKYLGMSPFQCPSLFSILSFLEYEHGVWHPIGGCGAVSQAMARIARDLGAKIHTDKPVKQLLFEGKRAVGVETEDGIHKADAVIVNADFAHAMRTLVPNRLRRRWTDRKLAKKKYSSSTFMLYLGLEGTQDELPHHMIYLSQDYRRYLDEIGVHQRLPHDPAFYLQNACVTDLTLAPSGRSTLYALVPVPNDTPNVNWKQQKEPFRQVMLEQMKKLGVQDVESRIRVEHIMTPDDWIRAGIYRGAIFNLAHNLRQMLHLRPRNRFEDLESVYLVGGGTHPGSGLPTIYSSARITSTTLLADLGLTAPSPRPRDEAGSRIPTFDTPGPWNPTSEDHAS
jgi:phytoene desaturase